MKNRIGSLLALALFAANVSHPFTTAGELPAVIPAPDGKPGAPDKPVKVFILSGQSNMCGMGKPDSLKPLPTSDEKFKYLIDADGKWTVRKDVYYLYKVMGTKMAAKGWLTVGKHVGPEVGIGHILGTYCDEPVLLIKVACGNRSLGYDVMAPTSRKRLGITEKGGKWYCGISYDKWVKGAQDMLTDLKQYWPEYHGKGYEIGGFFWWQGHKDKGMAQEKYEKLLAELIEDFRADFKAPKAPFVVATIGFDGKRTGAWTGVFNAQMAVSDPARHPEFAGNVASVDIRPLGGGGYHYGCNGARYTRIGDAMGRAMVGLLKKTGSAKKTAAPERKETALTRGRAPATKNQTATGTETTAENQVAAASKPAVDPSAAKAQRLLETAQTAEEMGQRDAAKAFYKSLVAQYPKTEAAQKAMERLKGL